MKVISTLLVFLLMTGCASMPWNTADKTIERSQTHRQEWQDTRLAAEKEMFLQPTIEFRMSAAMLRAAASIETEYDKDGNEIPAFELVYRDPTRRFTDYVEHPIWYWLPSGRDVLWTGVSVYGIQRNYTMAKRQLESQERREFRFYDTQDRMVDRSFDLATQGEGE